MTNLVILLNFNVFKSFFSVFYLAVFYIHLNLKKKKVDSDIYENNRI